MRPICRVLAALLAAGLLAAAGAAAETLWVSSRGAKLKAAPKALSKTVTKLAAGAAVTVLEADGKWYRVAGPAGEEGWVYRGKVSATAPAAETEASGSLFGAVAASGIEAGAADTSRSIRGLSPETEQYADGAGSPQEARDALDRVTALTVDEADLERFLQEGRIGEYAP